MSLRPAQAVSKTLSQKPNTNQRAGGRVAQVIEYLPNMCVALGSVASTVKINKQAKKSTNKTKFK